MPFLLLLQEPTNKPTKQTDQTNQPNKPTMLFDFEKERARLKAAGYTLVDYTAKIKKYPDIVNILDKMRTTNNGEFVYKKMIIIIQMEIVCKRIKVLKEVLMSEDRNPDAIQVFYTKYAMSFDYNNPPSPIGWTAFLEAKDENECSICCETKKFSDMMACPSCIYPFCRECFLKKYERDGDDRCFGCRRPVIKIYEKDEKV